MAERRIPSTINKTLLKNVIKHTDSHNKVVEETEMWKQRQRETKNVEFMGTKNSFLKDRRVDMKYEFSDHRERSAHMDDEPRSTYWMNELYKAEEADENRWGHSGFKELYPEKFNHEASCRGKKRRRSHDNHTHRRDDSTNSESSSTEDSDRDRKHRDKRKKKDKSKKKRKKKRKQSDSESNHDSGVDNDRLKKKRKKKHKLKDRKKKKKRRRKHSSSDNE